MMNGKIVNDPELLLDEWVSDFSWLAKSRRESLPSLQKLQCEIEKLPPERGETRLSALSRPIPACHGSPSQTVAGFRAGYLHQQLLCRGLPPC